MYDSPIRSRHTRSRESTSPRRELLATGLIAALLVAGIVVASLDPVSVVLLVEGVLVLGGLWTALPRLREVAPTEVKYRVPGLDLDVEIAVSTAN
ncbi:MAG: hypothetical protein ABEH66_07235 [Halobacteriales archaeon]